MSSKVSLRRRDLLQAAGAAALLPGWAYASPTESDADSPRDPWAVARAIVRRVRPPSFPNRDFPIADFGSDAEEGTGDASHVIARAIQACSAAGGGRVVVPAGDWLTGPIRLKSNVNLHLDRGAILRFKTDPNAYLPPVFTRWEGVELLNYSPFIYAFEEENIAVTGAGTIDGQCSNEHWWPWKGPWARNQHGWHEGMPNQRPSRALLFQMAEDDVPVERRMFGDGHYLRPNFIQPYRCRNVLIEGVSLRRAPMWQVHPVLCQNVIVRKLNIDSHGPNNDGVNIESCRDVLVEDCYFSTGDDCIAVNSGRNADGRRVNVPAENIVIRNCVMADGHGGLTVGSQISGHARNIFAEECRLDSPNLDTAIRFKNNALRGGIVENCYFRDNSVGQVARAVLTVDFKYEEGAAGPFKPVLRNVFIERLSVERCQRLLDLQALPGAPATRIELRDCDIMRAEDRSIVEHVENLVFERVRINGVLARSP